MFDKSEQWRDSSPIGIDANFIFLVNTLGTILGTDDKPDPPEAAERKLPLLPIIQSFENDPRFNCVDF